jgi:hypothetical protein
MGKDEDQDQEQQETHGQQERMARPALKSA